MIDQCLVAAVGALLAFGCCTVQHILLECALYAVLPGVDAFAVELERADQFHHLFNGHAVAQHARDQFGVVPVLLVELFRESFDGHLVASFVLKLEVVALVAVFIHVLDDMACRDVLGQYDALIVIQHTGEDFVGMSVEQADEGHPLLLVVLKTNDISFQDTRTYLYYRRRFAGGQLLFLVLLGGD